jgi:signal transduction histidine kinase
MKRSKKILSFAVCLILLASLLTPLIHTDTVHAQDIVPMQGNWALTPVTTCQELQDITSNLAASYSLSNDLNCNGAGFISIGQDINGNTVGTFTGRFYGQGHTISNLGAPLFGEVDSAIIANLNLSNSLDVTVANGLVGLLVISMSSGLVIDVHATGTIVFDQFGVSAGGLLGAASGVSIVRSSAVITTQIVGAQSQYGGLAVYASNTHILDSYAVTAIQISTGFIEHGGGLAVYGIGLHITNSYASGSINDPSQVHEIGGLVWYGTGVDIQVINSFSRFQGAGLCNGGNGCSGLVTVADSGLDLSTDYFDQTTTGTGRCTGDGSNTTCHVINTDGSQGSYFNNNSTNVPLNNWNFSSVWATTVGLPTLRAPSNLSPQPDAVQQLSSSIDSSTAINLNWTLPTNMGSAPFLGEEVYYKADGETIWHIVFSSSLNSYISSAANFSGTSQNISNLPSGTAYTIGVVLYNQDGYFSTATTNGVTATPGFKIINTCQQLQDMTNNLVDNFELGQNIDCSNSANWNNGKGFAPIGCQADTSTYVPFTGALEGNNYTVSNLNIDGASCYLGAIFASTSDALIQDLTISGPVMRSVPGYAYANAVVSGYDQGSTFNNIHINGDFSGTNQLIAGGLIGLVNGPTTTTINRVSFTGAVNGEFVGNGTFGGLIGIQYGPASISDSYVQANLIRTSTESPGGQVGGLVSYSGAPLQITNSYASLSYDGAGGTYATNATMTAGGLIGVADVAYSLSTLSITHSFATTQFQNLPLDRISFGGLVGVIYDSDGTIPDPVDLSSNYFDADLIATNLCAGGLPAFSSTSNTTQPSNCIGITGQPNYFNNNSSSPPLNSWDFNNIWQITSTLPVFGRKTLTTVTPIPPSRLTPKKPAAVTAAIKTLKANPAIVIAQQRVRAQSSVTQPTPATPQGIIAQLKELVGHVPTAVLVSFPFILFGLLFLAALTLLIEMLHQAKRLQKLNLLLAEQRSVADKRDTFWHLAANYLRAPITLLMGGTDLLALNKENTAETKQLTALSQRLQTKVAKIMQSIEKSHTLQNIKPPRTEKPIRVWRSAGFWAPLVTVAVLVTLTNYMAHSWRHLHVGTISLVSQALVYLLVALLLYWAMSGLGVANRRRRNAEQLLQRQEQALDAARLNLIQQTATDLDADVSRLQMILAKLPADSRAKPVAQEGASRLRHLIDSFQLLISAQNNRLAGLSPAGAQTSLDHVFKASLAELEPEIAAKHLTIALPTKLDLVVPGSPNVNNQVISSVLANAVAFSRSGSKIELVIDQTGSGVSLTVADNGPGITPSQQTHLFEPFTKADGQTGLQLDHGGLGISLYLDREIMDYLGGQIIVHSQEGQGTAVELRWPHTAGVPARHPGMVVQPTT